MVIIFLLFPLFLISAEFTASMAPNLGEMVTLNLTLKDATPKGTPSLQVLDPLFTIQSQAESTNTRIINGSFSSSTSWKLTLIPKVKGDIEIPSISINTSEGVLTTQALKVQDNKDPKPSEDFQLIAKISIENPYKNQPFFYTLKLKSNFNVTNIQIQKLEIEDAIVEAGNTNELTYVITPLKSGPLKIPSILIQGEVIDSNLNDPFARMWAFDRLKPFAVSTEPTTLDIKAPLVQPWLPASAMQLEELWDANQLLREGEPITWGFKINALGVKSSQLPILNLSSTTFKIYADKPEAGDEIKLESIHSFRKEYYTLIPSSSGALTLPEVSLQWWDVNKNQLITEKLPQRTLSILPALEKPKEEAKLEPQIIVLEKDETLLYTIIGVLSVLLFGTLTWLVILRRKLKKAREDNEDAFKPSKKEKLPDLNPT